MNLMVKFLYEGLKEKIYEKEEVTYIENCRSHVRKSRSMGQLRYQVYS